MSKAPNAPTPATSDGVAQPPYMAAITTTMSAMNGSSRGMVSKRSRQLKRSSGGNCATCAGSMPASIRRFSRTLA